MQTNDKALCYLTINEACQLIEDRQLSPVELTQAFLARIETVDGKLHSYFRLLADQALVEARVAEAEILRGHYRGPLHGIPIAVKDQIDVQGAPAAIRHYDSAALEKTEDSTVVRKLREAGAVILGKLAMSGLPGDPPQARNPWNTEHITGGSSTGPGAAVAAGLCMAAIGEDTAGSIRNPASLCGIVGLKPTYGRISRYGLAPLSWSLDHLGPMTWVVEDAAYILQAVAGYDRKDFTSGDVPIPDYTTALREDIKGMAIGIPRDFIEACRSYTDSETVGLVDEAIGQMASLGAIIKEVAIPTMKLTDIASEAIYTSEYFTAHRSEAQSVLSRGATSKRARIYLGLMTGAADYIQAQRIRSLFKRECAAVFQTIDLLALPCQLTPAPKISEVEPLDTIYRHLIPEYHAPFNLAGLPAISIPCGFSSTNLPVALQIVGKPFDESTVLRAAYTYQQHARWYEKRPPI